MSLFPNSSLSAVRFFAAVFFLIPALTSVSAMAEDRATTDLGGYAQAARECARAVLTDGPLRERGCRSFLEIRRVREGGREWRVEQRKEGFEEAVRNELNPEGEDVRSPEGRERERKNLSAALRWTAEDAERMARGKAVPIGEDRKRLLDILARPEFKTNLEPPKQSRLGELLQRWSEAFSEALRPFSESLGRLFSNLGLPFRHLMGFAAVAILVYLIYMILTRRGARVKPAREEREGPPGEDFDLDPETMLEERDAREKAGDYRGAVRFGFLHFLKSLERRGLVRCWATRTNGEYLFELESRTHPPRCVYELTRRYERAWYGGKPCDREEYERFKAEIVEGLERLEAAS